MGAMAHRPINTRVYELDYLPWLNVKLILQYNVYQVVANNQSPFNLSNANFPNSPGFPNIKRGTTTPG